MMAAGIRAGLIDWRGEPANCLRRGIAFSSEVSCGLVQKFSYRTAASVARQGLSRCRRKNALGGLAVVIDLLRRLTIGERLSWRQSRDPACGFRKNPPTAIVHS